MAGYSEEGKETVMAYRMTWVVLVLCCAFLACGGERKPDGAFLDNGTVRLGVDLGAGGSIFYFAQSTTQRNLLNHRDLGRFIQQSYYGKKDGSLWAKKPWCWNPVQGGGYKGQQARLLEKKIEKETLYIRSMPKHWATGADVPEITTHCWDILGVAPESMMCATSRMIVKRRDGSGPVVVPCTLLPYDPAFELGRGLAQASKTVSLNHPHCAKFCVLGGASCSPD